MNGCIIMYKKYEVKCSYNKNNTSINIIINAIIRCLPIKLVILVSIQVLKTALYKNVVRNT